MTSTDLVPTKHPGSENLIPFRKGSDARRKAGRGSPSALDDPEFVELFAKAVSEGLTITQLAELFSVARSTINLWKKDLRVKAAAMKIVEERVLSISRRVDREIEARLQEPKDITIDELLKIRKEFLGGALRLQTQGSKNDDRTVHESQTLLEENPEFATELQELLRKNSTAAVPDDD